MKYRYYSTQRPIAPGTIPTEPKPTTVFNFLEPTFIEEIGKNAWGFVDYPCELSTEEISNCELTPENTVRPNLDIHLVALAATEAYRLKGGNNDDADYAIRVCQAIVAEALGYKGRTEWTGKIQSEGLLSYNGDYKEQYNSLVKTMRKETYQND